MYFQGDKTKGAGVMKALVYQVEFLSDIVLPATSNTEGNIERLDFIPGSNFLGIVAQYYEKFENSFDIFHSGKVKFGDATLLKDGKPTYKMPLSYFHKKLDGTTLYNHHLLNTEEFQSLGQLKQKRSGYITSNNEWVEIEYSYSQKSAYDTSKRRSKEGAMFGYSAIKRGTRWQFVIRYDDTISQQDEDTLKESIVGTKGLGKSKSAQYGLVKISLEGEEESIEDIQANRLILYAKSRIALVDKEGNPTLDLKYLFDGLETKNIDYSKCQLKTSTFTPYNRARETKDYERVCINKGSVIVLQDIDKDKIPHYVGAYQSEGFGELLVNPKFLLENRFSLKEDTQKSDPKDYGETIQTQSNNTTVQFLINRHNQKLEKLTILNEVDDFIKQYYETVYKNIKPSQWGKIRSICTSGQNNYKEEIRDYVSNGVKQWEQRQIDTLLNENHSLEFMKLLSIQMPKQGG